MKRRTTITREELREVARLVIDAVPSLNSADVIALLGVADTAPRVAGSSQWFDRVERCGCLVGWLMHERFPGHEFPPESSALYDAGLKYVYALDEVMGNPTSAVLEVVD